MNEENIQFTINRQTSFKAVEKEAERLTYLVQLKKSEWRTRYDSLRADDFKLLGWTVFCIGSKKRKEIAPLMLMSGLKQYRNEDIYFNKETKTMAMVDEYGSGTYVSVIDTWNNREPLELITLDEYKSLTLQKLTNLIEKRNEVVKFIDSLIGKHKYWIEQDAQEEIKQQIIREALENAEKKGLIKL